MSAQTEQELRDAKPPFFKKWSGMYWLLMGTLAVLVLLFYWFTKSYE
ncbi:hypothetical protein EV198_0593 [Roseivirga ehrenbergii]|nr:hypothetical protein EV198_0593 [Roseivirga ehrenbergii]